MVFIGFSDNQILNFWWRALVLVPLVILVTRGCDSQPQTPMLVATHALRMGSRLAHFTALV
ncbi:hypothetical protein [Schlesneria sp.]|uniref:hypothetical protein n=1 Tax=Schlesneria sp. TaxID=2762018 RepID=UPI002F1950F6